MHAPILRWCVASCMDGGAHLAVPVAGGTRALPICGRTPFRPLAVLARPTDARQGCPACLLRQAREHR